MKMNFTFISALDPSCAGTPGAGLGRRRATSWVTLGALVAYASVGERVTSVVFAEESGTAARRDGAAAPGQQPVHRFDIPAGDLADVLAAFQDATGIDVLVNIPEETMRSVHSPGVSGVFTAEQALLRILADTAIDHRFTGPDAVTLELQRRETVEVTASRAYPSSPKYTEPLRDTPQTITVIPSAVIAEQGATTLRDVLQNVPGLTIAAGEGGTPAGDNLTLRGFSARNDVFVDGVRDLGPQSRDPFNLEQVEVVKGPSSTFSGRGSTGGSVNLVSKAPLLGSAYGGSLSLGTDQTRRLTADLNQPLRVLGESTSLRLNVMAHDADVAGRDAVTNRRWGVAPALGFGLGTATRLTLAWYHLQQDNLSDYGIPWVPSSNEVLVDFRDEPAPVPRETFYGYRSRDREKMSADLATASFQHDVDASLHLRSQLRYGRTTRNSIATPPRFASPDSTVIDREMRSWLTEDDVWDSQTDLQARFRSGSLEHALVAGVAASREGNVRRTRTAPNAETTLLDPDPDDVYPGEITLSPVVGGMEATSLAAYAFDTVTLGPHLELSGGLRYDDFDADGTNTDGTPLSRVDRMLSWRAGVVVKPRPEGSVYAGAGTSFNPSLEGLTYGGRSTDPGLDPEKTYTVEVGSKWDLLGERLSVAGSVFRVEKTNARTPGVLPDDPPTVLEGEQRVSGVELGITGQITPSWQVFASYTRLDSAIASSNDPTEVGHELPQTPPHALSVWTTLRLPRRLELGAGARFVGRRYSNTSNARRVDGYWAFDAMATVPLGPRLDLRLNVYNLTDAYYFDRVGGGHVVPGPARSATVSANLSF
jgi:catecholate siderophore receptor